MSKLEELIEKLCPNGVEYKNFSDVALYIRGVSYSKSKEINNSINGFKLLRANNITLTSNTLNFDEIKIIDYSVNVKENQMLKKNDILICAGSGSKEHIGKVAFINEDIDYTFGGFMGVIRCNEKKIKSRYLFHIMTGPIFKEHLFKVSNSSTINNINNDTWKDFCIPVPPLEVQCEIVHVLDDFTLLSAELSAELKARQKQFEYYKTKLLSIDGKKYKLGEIADFRTGVKPKYILEQSQYEYINAGTTNSGYTESKNFKGDVVTTPSRGQGGIGFVGYQKNEFWLGPLCYAIWSKNEKILINKYLYYELSSKKDEILKRKNTGGVPALNGCDLKTIPLNIPSVEEQIKIVNLLDEFEKICENISSGLPAEIEARQKQYEYYRDKLLSFNGVKNNG